MNISDEDKDISRLIARELVYGLNEEEKHFLEEWKKKSERNQVLYEYLSDFRHVQHYGERLNRIDPQLYWERLQQTVAPRRRVIHWLRVVAAAAVVVILIGGGITALRIFEYSSRSVTQDIVNAKNMIVPGKMRATLVLAGGEKIELGKKDEKEVKVEGMEIQDDQIIVKEKLISGEKELEWNKLLIPRGGEYKLVLGDGSVVYINAESHLEFPVEFSGKQRVVYLQGEAYFKVARDTVHPFIVKTDQMDIQVLGTEFNVKAYQAEEHVQATLVKGSVRVATGKEKTQIMDLIPLQQADWDITGNQLVVRKVDIGRVIAWKNGQLIFKDERLEDIMTVLARWYDFEVCYQSDRIRNMVFAGKLNRLESIRPILEIIESTDKIHIEKQGKSLILSEK